jgi:hypothetical protein
MSNHQFILKLKEEANTGRKTNEGLDLSVYSLVTDSERDVKTLSGGESFLAALAMALGLSDIVERSAGAIHPDMMFIMRDLVLWMRSRDSRRSRCWGNLPVTAAWLGSSPM